MKTATQLTANDTKELVLSFIDALNKEDFDAAGEYLTPTLLLEA